MYGTDRVARVTVSATTPLAKIQPDEATYFLYDHLGNTRVAFSVNGSNVPLIVNALDYYSYGKILREYDNGAGDRYLTTGHERDQKTGLDYRGARYYDSDVVRFLSLDPMAVKYPMLSPYNYVAGNPIMLIDPDGREIRDSEGKDISTKKHERQTRWTENHVMLNEVFGDPSGFTSAIIPKLGSIKSFSQAQHDQWLSLHRSNPYTPSQNDITQTDKDGSVYLRTNSRKKTVGKGDLWELGCPMLYRVNGGDQIFALTPIYVEKEVSQGWMIGAEVVLNPTDKQFQEFLDDLNGKIKSIENTLTKGGYGNFVGTLSSSPNAPKVSGIQSYMKQVTVKDFLPPKTWNYGIEINGTKTIEFYNYK
ncbi:RHS repeat-associated core domain-containing protein [Fluviicola sp.]|uniref:RHS repeat-associated core domain-containing protein n=1 Tax=Fluviicola sp. TaxID=1917219 RepID=UPI003D2B2308